MAIISYTERTRHRYPALAHLYPAQPPTVPAPTRPGRAPATHRKGISGHPVCGTTSQFFLHVTEKEEEITCRKCHAGHCARK